MADTHAEDMFDECAIPSRSPSPNLLILTASDLHNNEQRHGQRSGHGAKDEPEEPARQSKLFPSGILKTTTPPAPLSNLSLHRYLLLQNSPTTYSPSPDAFVPTKDSMANISPPPQSSSTAASAATAGAPQKRSLFPNLPQPSTQSESMVSFHPNATVTYVPSLGDECWAAMGDDQEGSHWTERSCQRE